MWQGVREQFRLQTQMIGAILFKSGDISLAELRGKHVPHHYGPGQLNISGFNSIRYGASSYWPLKTNYNKTNYIFSTN